MADDTETTTEETTEEEQQESDSGWQKLSGIVDNALGKGLAPVMERLAQLEKNVAKGGSSPSSKTPAQEPDQNRTWLHRLMDGK